MSNQWKTQETRCIARNPRDRKRCKLDTGPGDYLCKHHKFDLASLANDPSTCINIMTERFPKRHHPACDSKGENDCKCHDFSRGAHTMMTIKKAFEQSKLLSPLYKKYLKVTMSDKVRRIRNYYNSITEDDLYLPPYSNFRQYRFFTWDKKSQRVVVRKLQDNVRTKAILLSHLRRLAPLHVYYTTGQWLNPQGIGPDPKSRRGQNKFRKKRWCSPSGNVTQMRYHNTLIKRDLYFDVDYDNKDYNQGIKMVEELISNLIDLSTTKVPVIKFMPENGYKNVKRWTEYKHRIQLPDLRKKDFDIVFSGGKGFHVILNGFYDKATVWDIKGSSFLSNTITNKNKRPMTEFVNNENKNDLIEEIYLGIVHGLKSVNKGLLLDWMVTYDNRRIIRLPGTVHGKTMKVCTMLSGFDDTRIAINDYNRVVGYNADGPIP